jgi:septal ring factor EnvC (AmiA/AmiB activator)
MSLGSSAAAGPSPEQLQNRIAGLQRHEHALQSSIHSDTANLRRLRAPMEDLFTRLHGLEASLAVERRQLDGLQAQLRTAHSQLASLQAQLARDLAALRVQLVADYESTPPDLVTVILDSHGFADLLERVDALRRIEHGNVQTTFQVKTARAMVARQVNRLAERGGKGLFSSAPTSSCLSHLWSRQVGRIVAWHVYRDVSEALEAVGLRVSAPGF